MEKEFENGQKPSPRRRAQLGCLLGIFLLLCAGGLALAGRFLAAPQPLAATSTALPSTATVPPRATEASAGATSQPVPPGRIAFVTAEGRLGSVDPDGSNARTLTGANGFYLFPAWAPDGRRLAAIGSNREEAGVYLLEDQEDASPVTLFASDENAPIYLSWAPDGDLVSFIAPAEDSLGLYLAPADGSEQGRLLATGQPFYWDWSSGGKRILIHSGGDADDARLAFLDIAEQQGEENIAAPGFFQAPGISPDEVYVAFASVEGEDERWLVVAAQEDDTMHRVAHRGAVALSWSPTAPRLAFISPEFAERRPLLDYHGPLRLLDARSGETEVLVADPVLAFFWAPDGSQLAYLTVADANQQREAGHPGRFARRSKDSAQHEEVRLALGVVQADTGERERIFTFTPTDLFLRQFLPFFDQYALSHRLWAPDSSGLVVPVQEGREEIIYMVPVEGEARPVAEGEVAFWSGQ